MRTVMRPAGGLVREVPATRGNDGAATRRDKSPGGPRMCAPGLHAFRLHSDERGDEGGSVRELIAGKPALIVIDMQNGGLEPSEVSGISHMAGYRDRIDRVVAVADACRGAGIPVIFFQEIHRRDLVDFGRELDGAERVHCLEGDPGTDLVDELRPGPGDYFIQKRRY